jgi:hypothetical protein
MNDDKLFAHIVTKGMYLVCLGFSLIVIAYTWGNLINFGLSFLKEYNWFVRSVGCLLIGLIGAGISIFGAYPLFWLDGIKRKKSGWLGDIYRQLDNSQ